MNAVYQSPVIVVFVFIVFQFLHLCCRTFASGTSLAAERWRADRDWPNGRDDEQDQFPSSTRCSEDRHAVSDGPATDPGLKFGTDASKGALTSD